MSLASIAGATIPVAGTDDVGTGTINNDDSQPNIFIDDLALNEGETSLLVVSLSEVSGLNSVYRLTALDGTALSGNGDFTGFSALDLPFQPVL